MKYTLYGLGIVAALVVAFAVVKKVSPVGWGMWGTTNTSSGLALAGYDPVAYFEQSAATRGNSRNAYEWADATWHFSTSENRDLFAASPDKYAPRFGSFCSFAVSKGFTADSDPTAWHIEDERLYVFMDENVRDQWVAGIADGTLRDSEANWRKR